jgi:mersacidin/lichenicidin family type 2 lantibiotic
MSHLDVIRAWKDPEYRLSLTDAERAKLPAHPAGLSGLFEAELDSVQGGVIALPLMIGLAVVGTAYCVGYLFGYRAAIADTRCGQNMDGSYIYCR